MAIGNSSPAILYPPPPARVRDNDGRQQREKAPSRSHSRGFSLQALLRITHEWTAIIVAIPLLFIIVTGIFLQLRKPVEWIQPNSEKGVAGYDPQVLPADVLDAVKVVPEMKVASWNDILLLDYRPKKGIIKVRNPGHFETQIDAKTGAVLKSGQRWNDIVMRLHDGSAMGIRYWVFLPVSLLTLYLLISGTYLGVKTTAGKMRLQASRRRSRKFARENGKPVTVRKKPFNLTTFCRRYHYWLAVIVIFPWFIVICSGIVLQLRDQIPGVHPELKQGSSTNPMITYARVLAVSKSIPEMKVRSWSDIWRVYTYPEKGVMTVRTKRDLMAQIDSATGEVLDVSPRSADFWEDVHEGIFGRHQPYSLNLFGGSKVTLALTLFLPIHILAVLLWSTGVFFVLKTRLGTRRAHGQSSVSGRATGIQ